MRDPLRELEHLGKLAAADPTKRFGKLYRLVSHIELLTLAGERVRQNTGGRTAGKQGPANVIASGQEQRVKLICHECHKQHHPGGWSVQQQTKTGSYRRAGCSEELPAQF